MFIVDTTAEDIRFIAKSKDCRDFEVCIIDNMTGESLRTEMPGDIVAAINFCLLSVDPEESGLALYIKANNYLGKYHPNLPLNLRPIP
jgi:hypothetical protein